MHNALWCGDAFWRRRSSGRALRGRCADDTRGSPSPLPRHLQTTQQHPHCLEPRSHNTCDRSTLRLYIRPSRCVLLHYVSGMCTYIASALASGASRKLPQTGPTVLLDWALPEPRNDVDKHRSRPTEWSKTHFLQEICCCCCCCCLYGHWASDSKAIGTLRFCLFICT